MTGSTARMRKTFKVVNTRPDLRFPTYDVHCLVERCFWESVTWDYRRNALRAGYEHALTHEPRCSSWIFIDGGNDTASCVLHEGHPTSDLHTAHGVGTWTDADAARAAEWMNEDA